MRLLEIVTVFLHFFVSYYMFEIATSIEQIPFIPLVR